MLGWGRRGIPIPPESRERCPYCEHPQEYREPANLDVEGWVNPLALGRSLHAVEVLDF